MTVSAGKATLSSHVIRDLDISLPALVEDFREACADPRREWQGPAYGLYQLLFADATPRFAKKRRLFIVPTGPLWGLPVSALLNENGVPLAEKFEMSYVASALGVQTALRSSSGAATRSLIIEGVAPAQVAAVKSVFPDAASRPAIPLASDARLLHITAPLTFDSAAPMGSQLGAPPISLSAEPSAKSSATQLSVRQIMVGRCDASVVVVAPPTVTPKHPLGASWEMLHWAFLSAGVSAQIIAIQGVSDNRAALFCRAFYSRLKNGQTVGAAQRAAIHALRADPRTAHPINWAPFLLFGNGDTKMGSHHETDKIVR